MGKKEEEKKERDLLDVLDILGKPVGAIVAGLMVAYVGFLGTAQLNRYQDVAMRTRLYTELMSQREEAESALRKDMFGRIMDEFMKPTTLDLKEKLLKLELLAYNFHESLNIEPLFKDLKEEIEEGAGENKEKYLKRLTKAAREVTGKQVAVLEGVGRRSKPVYLIDFANLGKTLIIKSIVDTFKLDSIEREFKIRVIDVDTSNKEMRIHLEIRTIRQPPDTNPVSVDSTEAKFWLGFFDFPMIDNTRLTNDQRCALVLNEFAKDHAEMFLLYFPGTHASLREKPYYEEMRKQLISDNAQKK